MMFKEFRKLHDSVQLIYGIPSVYVLQLNAIEIS